MKVYICDRCGEILKDYNPRENVTDYDLCDDCSGVHRAHQADIAKKNSEYFKGWKITELNRAQ